MTPQAVQLEAYLFTTADAVAKQELMRLLGVEDSSAMEALIDELRQSLADHGLTLLSTSTHLQLVTSPAAAEFLSALNTPGQETLSKAASETLALIAYRGPISRYDLDILRGVDSRSMIRQLLRRGLIAPQKNAAQVTLYDISEEFLRHMGIVSRQDLPNYTTLSQDERIHQLLGS